jgi:hypothetical protein
MENASSHGALLGTTHCVFNFLEPNLTGISGSWTASSTELLYTSPVSLPQVQPLKPRDRDSPDQFGYYSQDCDVDGLQFDLADTPGMNQRNSSSIPLTAEAMRSRHELRYESGSFPFRSNTYEDVADCFETE